MNRKGRSIMRWMKYLAAGALALAGGVTVAQQAPADAPSLLPQPAAKPGAALPLPSSVDGQHALTRQDADAWLDGFLPYALARGDVAGAVVVIVKDGQVLTQRGFGYADVAARKPVDPATTLFRPGSVSKLYTWTAVMQQVEAGRLNLDADVNQYLDFKIPAYQGKPITLRNIMTHTAGFEEAGRDLIGNSDSIPTLEAALKRWTPHRVYAPGSTPAYSNYATALAGYIVQRVSGMPFDDYIERNIFQRLGMQHASFRQPLPAALQPHMARGYELGSGEAKPFEIVSVAPAGSSSISGGDMAKFMIAHLDNGGPLLKPETAKLMHSPANEPLPGLNHMMLGFYEEKINGISAIAHGGDTRWFHSDLTLFPSKNVGIYISLNSMGKEGAVGPIRNSFFKQFADRYFPAPKAFPKELATAKAHATQVAGTYASSRAPVENWAAMMGFLGQMEVGTDKDGKLSIPAFKTIGGAPRKWVEVSPYIWQSTEDGDQFAARVENGKVTRVFYGPVAPIMVWDPVPWYKDTAWLKPLAIAALAILALTGLAWPAGAINRKRYGAKLERAGHALILHRLVPACAWAVLALLGSWLLVVIKSSEFVTSAGLIWFNQIAGLLLFFGFVGVAGWNMYLAFQARRGWFGKLWSILLLLAAIVMLWVALAFHLISFGANW
ncbi:serine hydrolase [Sphingobium sp. Leaf26]|nr:serine hydrolase [Sphingobium sp. Leaf26]